MLVLSPKIENYDIRGFMLIPKNNCQFQKNTRCVNEWVNMHEVTMSSDYSTSCFPSTKDDEEKVINLKDMIKKVNLVIITCQNDHYDGIISNEFQLDYFPTRPTTVSFNRWKLVLNCDTLFPIFKSSNDNHFVQCGL